MAALTTQSIGYAGTKPTTTNLSTSDTAEVGTGANTFLIYRNTTATPVTLTLSLPTNFTPYTEATAATVTYSLAATTGELWIPLHEDYADATGRVTITANTAPGAGCNVAVVRADWGGSG